MHYDYHTTRHIERMRLLEAKPPREFVWRDVKPAEITGIISQPDRGRPIVWEESTGRIYSISYLPIFETLLNKDNDPRLTIEQTTYYRTWVDIKGREYCVSRVQLLFQILEDMRRFGFKKDEGPFGVAMEQTGEKLDGSHRAVVAQYLRIPEIRIKEYAFQWEDMDEDFISRKIQAKKAGEQPNYYFIDYGNGITNLDNPSAVYKENSYGRWDVLKKHIKGDKILDLGCNEGFMSIQLALQGKHVVGVDHDFIVGANTNKLIFEFLNKRRLDVTFIEDDICHVGGTYDTALILNAIYHNPRPAAEQLIRHLRQTAKRIVLQGNLRKIHEHERWYGITVEDMVALLKQGGYTNIKVVEWRDKPIVIGE